MLYLSGDKVSLRPLEMEDLDLIYQWENNTVIWEVSHTLVPYSKHVLKQYLANAHEDIYVVKQLRMVIQTVEKKPVGLIDLFDFDAFHSRVGVGILIASDAERKKGFAKESLQLIIDYTAKHLGLKQIYCNITFDNQASINLFTSLGFVPCGLKKEWIKVQNKWKDELMFQLIL